MQLGLHVHAAVNAENDRLHEDEHRRHVQGPMPRQNGNEKDTTDRPQDQRQATEVGRWNTGRLPLRRE